MCDNCSDDCAKMIQPEALHRIKAEELLEIQGRDGNWNYDPYMHGMYNGMALILAIFKEMDPEFRNAPESWISEPKKV